MKRLIHESKFDDRPNVLKASLMFVEDNKIHTLGGDHGGVTILCQDCIEGILDSLDSSALRDRKIDNILK